MLFCKMTKEKLNVNLKWSLKEMMIWIFTRKIEATLTDDENTFWSFPVVMNYIVQNINKIHLPVVQNKEYFRIKRVLSILPFTTSIIPQKTVFNSRGSQTSAFNYTLSTEKTRCTVAQRSKMFLFSVSQAQSKLKLKVSLSFNKDLMRAHVHFNTWYHTYEHELDKTPLASTSWWESSGPRLKMSHWLLWLPLPYGCYAHVQKRKGRRRCTRWLAELKIVGVMNLEEKVNEGRLWQLRSVEGI